MISRAESFIIICTIITQLLCISDACTPICPYHPVFKDSCGSNACDGVCKICESGSFCGLVANIGYYCLPNRDSQVYVHTANFLSFSCMNNTLLFGKRANNKPSQNNLDFCSMYTGSTCCEQTTSDMLNNAAAQIRSALKDAADQLCVNKLEPYICAPCSPLVGVGALDNYPCKSYCDEIWDKCSTMRVSPYKTRYIPDPNSETRALELFTNVTFFQNIKFLAADTVLDNIEACKYYYDDSLTNDLPSDTCFTEDSFKKKNDTALSFIVIVVVGIIVFLLIVAVVVGIVLRRRAKVDPLY